MVHAIYNRNKEIIDYSDDGQSVRDLQSDILTEQLLNKLPPQQQKVIRLKMAGYKGKEIASMCGITVQTVYYYKKLVKQKFKEI